MRKMNKFVDNKFVVFLSISFFFSTIGFQGMIAHSKETGLPIGEMVLKGNVKFEAKEKVWKDIEPLRFPVFRKGKIKTEKGTGIITLINNCQIEMDQNSIISFDEANRFRLSQGRIFFRIPSRIDVTFKIGNLTIGKAKVLEAARGSNIAIPKNEETIGSISLHSNGSVTVRSLKGSLSILDQDQIVLSALSSKELITIPSVMSSGQSRTKVAQAGEIRESSKKSSITDTQEWEYLGLNAVEWIAVGYAAAIIGGLTYAFWPEHDRVRRIEQVPVCP
jgi:hypothetical protein